MRLVSILFLHTVLALAHAQSEGIPCININVNKATAQCGNAIYDFSQITAPDGGK